MLVRLDEDSHLPTPMYKHVQVRVTYKLEAVWALFRPFFLKNFRTRQSTSLFLSSSPQFRAHSKRVSPHSSDSIDICAATTQNLKKKYLSQRSVYVKTLIKLWLWSVSSWLGFISTIFWTAETSSTEILVRWRTFWYAIWGWNTEALWEASYLNVRYLKKIRAKWF